MIGAKSLDRSVVIRELMPEEKKAKLAALGPEEVREVGNYLGAIVGRSHARQMTAAQARSWLRAFGSNKKGRPAVPKWIWDVVVHLIGVHEEAYLNHCQKITVSQQEALDRTRQEEDPRKRSEKPRAGFEKR